MTKWDEFKVINDQMYEPRVFGKKNYKVPVFFKVQSKLSIPELVKEQLNLIKEYGFSLSIKEMKEEYAIRVGILLGVNLQFA